MSKSKQQPDAPTQQAAETPTFASRPAQPNHVIEYSDRAGTVHTIKAEKVSGSWQFQPASAEEDAVLEHMHIGTQPDQPAEQEPAPTPSEVSAGNEEAAQGGSKE